MIIRKVPLIVNRKFVKGPSLTSSALHNERSTIFALSSGFGKSAVAVVRVSGPGVRAALSFIGGFKDLPDPRRAVLKKLKDPQTSELIDHGLVFWFPGPKSFTGEDCCEFQVHGSSAVITALLSGLGKLKNFRPAEAGEFTKRAFYSGKMDLPEVEGVAALINAETNLQRKHALYQLSGELSKLYQGWAQTLIKSLAHLEAHIDFDEDQDIDNNVIDLANERIMSLIPVIKSHLEDGRRGERIREGVNVTILGSPNTGKSSLLNVLSQKQAAIVSSIPGTTRDIIRTHLDINGYPVNLSDTAGLRLSPSDEVEQEGINRALHAASKSDLILIVLDCALLPKFTSINSFRSFLAQYILDLGISSEIESCQNICEFLSFPINRRSQSNRGLVILNKIDLVPTNDNIHPVLKQNDCISIISCKTNCGIDDLLQKMTLHLEHLCGSHLTGFSRPYQRKSLENCLSHLETFLKMSSFTVDLKSEQLRAAVSCLGKITGEVSPNQLLEIIFSDFCIGK